MTANLYDRLRKAFEPFDCNHDESLNRRKFSVDRLPHCELRGLDRNSLVKCSILILLYENDKRLHIILTVRSFKLKNYPGELCFPGGKHDDSVDKSYEETAFREANEEIGLERENVKFIAKLCPIISPIGHYIVPIVGLLCHNHGDFGETLDIVNKLRPNADEVESIVSVPLCHFVENASNSDVIMLTDVPLRASLINKFGEKTKTIKRTFVFIDDAFFSGEARPYVNFVYGINACLILFVTYLSERSSLLSQSVDIESYRMKLDNMNSLFEPFELLDHPKLTRIVSFYMYKNYLDEKNLTTKSTTNRSNSKIKSKI